MRSTQPLHPVNPSSLQYGLLHVDLVLSRELQLSGEGREPSARGNLAESVCHHPLEVLTVSLQLL